MKITFRVYEDIFEEPRVNKDDYLKRLKAAIQKYWPAAIVEIVVDNNPKANYGAILSDYEGKDKDFRAGAISVRAEQIEDDLWQDMLKGK